MGYTFDGTCCCVMGVSVTRMPCSRRCASSRSRPADAAAGLATASSRIKASMLRSTCPSAACHIAADFRGAHTVLCMKVLW